MVREAGEGERSLDELILEQKAAINFELGKLRTVAYQKMKLLKV